jgi:glycine oxidase
MARADSADIIIVGGGVIGLSVAWHLARRGESVVVLERGQLGSQASGAAAGMLAPLAEGKGPGPLVDLGLASLACYPSLVNSLREETGLDPEFAGPGMLRVALDERADQALRAAFAWQSGAGLPLTLLTAEEARRLEPALSPATRLAVLSTAEKHVEPWRLVRALALATVRRGGRILEDTPVTGFEFGPGEPGQRVTAVGTTAGQVPCGRVVIAGGAWTEGIARWLDASLPIFPVRGQILALACLPPQLRHTVYTPGGYLVPKTNGRVVVGATEEHAGFASHPTAAGVQGLLRMARELMPALSDAPFQSAWAGLRPATPDGLPLIGPLAHWDNVILAAGHFRNGILLAPITAEVVAHGLMAGEWSALAGHFRADRFTGPRAGFPSPG